MCHEGRSQKFQRCDGNMGSCQSYKCPYLILLPNGSSPLPQKIWRKKRTYDFVKALRLKAVATLRLGRIGMVESSITLGCSVVSIVTAASKARKATGKSTSQEGLTKQSLGFGKLTIRPFRICLSLLHAVTVLDAACRFL